MFGVLGGVRRSAGEFREFKEFREFREFKEFRTNEFDGP